MARFQVIAVTGIFTILSIAGLQQDLYLYNDTPLRIFLHSTPRPNVVRLPLGQDIAAIAFLLAAVLKPVFCARQVELIEDYSRINHENSGWRRIGPPPNKITTIVASANVQFLWLQSRLVSLALGLASIANAVLLYTLIAEFGPYSSINPTELTQEQWTAAVYAGWWGSFHHDPAGAIGLCVLITYYTYYLLKQLLMGVVFAQYATRAHRAGFGVVANYDLNTDGYWGLLTLRRFMQWTYFSTVLDFVNALCFFLLWLPFTQLTVFVGLAVLTLNVGTVTYPSAVAFSSAQTTKQEYARNWASTAVTSAEDQARRDERLERFWQQPTLPFKARSTVAAVGIYLLAPLVIGLTSAILAS